MRHSLTDLGNFLSRLCHCFYYLYLYNSVSPFSIGTCEEIPSPRCVFLLLLLSLYKLTDRPISSILQLYTANSGADNYCQISSNDSFIYSVINKKRGEEVEKNSIGMSSHKYPPSLETLALGSLRNSSSTNSFN